MASKSDYQENQDIDFRFRGQAFTPPATIYVGLLTTSSTDVGPGTEVSGGAYARVAIAASMVEWAGTQGAGSTTTSTGTSGITSNNNPITFPVPSGANWGTVTSMALFDAITGGNMTDYTDLTTPKTINDGDAAPVFQAGSLTVNVDA